MITNLKNCLSKRSAAIKKCFKALQHHSACRDSLCPMVSCKKICRLYQHFTICTKKATCVCCNQFIALINLHSQNCKKTSCSVNGCATFKENLKALKHFSVCRDSSCLVVSCKKVYRLYQHLTICTEKAICAYCNKFIALINLHSQNCKETSCSVIGCATFKEMYMKLNRYSMLKKCLNFS